VVALAIGLSLFAGASYGRMPLAGRPEAMASMLNAGPLQQPVRVPVPSRVVNYTYEVINTWPHDPQAFTQGLVYHQGYLYESTGQNCCSSLRRVNLQTGQVLNKVDVSSDFFAEGLTIHNSRAIQLTWLTKQGFVYDVATFGLLRTFTYQGEGWGLTHDGRSLIMSDGTAELKFLNPDTFQLERSILVLDGAVPVTRLNELEYINGEVFANVWLTDNIVRINPQSGKITGRIDLTGLLSPEDRLGPVDVLNGIAYDPVQGRLFVTGKLWPKLFEIRLKLKRGGLTVPHRARRDG
jgi:glutamine cyclotransferase